MSNFSKILWGVVVAWALHTNAVAQLHHPTNVNKAPDLITQTCNKVKNQCEILFSCWSELNLQQSFYDVRKENWTLGICMNVLNSYNDLLKNKARTSTHNNFLLWNKFSEDKINISTVNNTSTPSSGLSTEEIMMHERMIQEEQEATGVNNTETGGCWTWSNNYNRNGIEITDNNWRYEVSPDWTIIMNGC